MKKFTLILISVFMMGSLMAQTGMGPLTTYSNFGGPGAQANILYSQMNVYPQAYSVVSQENTDDGKIAQDADDFVVPAGKTWDITGVSVYGNYFDGGSGAPALGPAEFFKIQIYADNGSGVPSGTPVYVDSLAGFTENSGVFGFTLSTPAQLSAGTYWISVFAGMSFNQKGEWGWAWSQDQQIGMKFANQDPDGFVTGSPLWPDTWASADVTWPNRVQYDLCFQLEGNETAAAVPVSNWAIIFGVFLIGVFMVVRYRRTLA